MPDADLRTHVESLLPISAEYVVLREVPHLKAFVIDLGVRMYEAGEAAAEVRRANASADQVERLQKCGACRHARLFHRDGKPCGVLGRMTDDECGCATFVEATGG